jgi:16S rRNA (cytidine1402-2'-O)-methyltransferase
MTGTLYVVATPIGNLEDLTFRALRILREVDLIAAEDTRRTAKLLARYEVRKSLVSLREHNEAKESPRIVARLAAGQSVALVSDAGTPAIADPGDRLVRAAREAGVPVVPIPGPSAITAALSVSGLEETSFVFLGFPPASGSQRTAWLAALSKERRTVVFFESPHRIRKTVEQIAPLVNSQIMIHHELTKINELSIIYPNQSVQNIAWHKGEFVIVVPPRPEDAVTTSSENVYSLFAKLHERAGLDEDLAVRLTATAIGVTEKDAAKHIKKGKILVKRQSEPKT